MARTYKQHQRDVAMRQRIREAKATGLTEKQRRVATLDLDVAAVEALTPAAQCRTTEADKGTSMAKPVNQFTAAVKALPRSIPGQRRMFGIRIEESLHTALKDQVERDGVSMADWLRAAIVLYVQDQRAKK